MLSPNFLTKFILAVLVQLTLWGSLAFVSPAEANEVTGELRIWHRVTVSFNGPQTSETAQKNPFSDYRLNVTFTHAQSGVSYVVPGFYAADGNAGESSGQSGGIWRVHFTPDHVGTWTYTASFRTGNYIAVNLSPSAGSATGFDGASGSFNVGATNKDGVDFRGKGMVRYVGEHYMQFAGTGEYYIKVGPDSPENLLAYDDFDGTYDTICNGESIDLSTHRYAVHGSDWKSGDPTWKSGKGKGLIGAINYLSDVGVSSLYFLTYNLDGGDGCDVWPWINEEERERFDVSKLDQWEIVFSHMDAMGIQLHVILTERENAKSLGPDDGLNPIRQLYYRELVARFGHHLAVQWNIGEENTNGDSWKIQFADYIRSIDPYDHPITVHTSDSKAYTFYEVLLGEPSFEATSLQADIADYNDLAIFYRNESTAAGRKWAVYADEQAPNASNSRADELRQLGLWGNLMGGGAGVEWYTQEDLSLEDFRFYDILWSEMGYARHFFQQYLPFEDMQPANELTAVENDYVLALDKQVYAVYLPSGGAVSLNIGGNSSTNYSVRWYNPRGGGNLQTGNVATVAGGGTRNLGSPPSDPTLDWVALVKNDAGTGGGDLPELIVSVIVAEGEESSLSDIGAKLKIERTGDISEPLSFSFTLSGTATEGEDYEQINEDQIIQAGKASKNINIRPLDDGETEGDETVVLTLNSGADYTLVSGQSSASVVIKDDDVGFMLGDTSQNNSLSALDASLVLQHVVGEIVLRGDAVNAGDVSGDGSMTAFDASLILQFIVGIIDCFPADAACN